MRLSGCRREQAEDHTMTGFWLQTLIRHYITASLGRGSIGPVLVARW